MEDSCETLGLELRKILTVLQGRLIEGVLTTITHAMNRYFDRHFVLLTTVNGLGYRFWELSLPRELFEPRNIPVRPLLSSGK